MSSPFTKPANKPFLANLCNGKFNLRSLRSSISLVRDFLGHAACFDSEFNDSAHRAIAARGYRWHLLARLPEAGISQSFLVLNA